MVTTRLWTTNKAVKRASIDKIIEELNQLRDHRIQALLNSSELMNFLEEHYNTFAISPVKLEF
ncbi:MAG TPA: hypothetical protein VIT44_01580 [Cyclobacteriaceae bacterium]